jgi:hypothetical protein
LGDHADCRKCTSGSWVHRKVLALRRVIDFVTGMTDNYAVYISKDATSREWALQGFSDLKDVVWTCLYLAN